MVTQNNVNNTSKFTKFTSSGTFTKDARTKFIYCIGFGAGGGGGSGRRGATSTGRGGGGSGTCAGQFEFFTISELVGTTETVTVGAGGNGAAGITTDDTNGGNGGNAGLTTIGNVTTSSLVSQVTRGSGGTTVLGGRGIPGTILSNYNQNNTCNTGNDAIDDGVGTIGGGGGWGSNISSSNVVAAPQRGSNLVSNTTALPVLLAAVS